MKKEQLRIIVREEIKKVLSEMIKPGEFLQEKFPEVIEYDRTQRMSSLYWTVISKKKWDRNTAADFQMYAGYHPAGYAGPYEFNEEKLEDGTFQYTWHCYASSD